MPKTAQCEALTPETRKRLLRVWSQGIGCGTEISSVHFHVYLNSRNPHLRVYRVTPLRPEMTCPNSLTIQRLTSTTRTPLLTLVNDACVTKHMSLHGFQLSVLMRKITSQLKQITPCPRLPTLMRRDLLLDRFALLVLFLEWLPLNHQTRPRASVFVLLSEATKTRLVFVTLQITHLKFWRSLATRVSHCGWK